MRGKVKSERHGRGGPKGQWLSFCRDEASGTIGGKVADKRGHQNGRAIKRGWKCFHE